MYSRLCNVARVKTKSNSLFLNGNLSQALCTNKFFIESLAFEIA